MVIAKVKVFLDHSSKIADTYDITACSVDELLKDTEIEVILNLTIPRAHYEVAKQSLENGKHVYSEKPMAVNFSEGEELLALSKSWKSGKQRLCKKRILGAKKTYSRISVITH